MRTSARSREDDLARWICDGRISRAVEAANPGFIRQTLDGFLKAGIEPSRERLAAAVDAAFELIMTGKAVTT
jgi:hypothetical protein